MKITNIKQQVKRADRYSVFVEGKYSFSLSGSELMRSGLALGQEVDEAGLAELKNTATKDKAYTRALDLIARRPRSRWELAEYLKRKDYPPEVVEEVVSRLSKAGYIDDLGFAQSWVESRRLLKDVSKRRLWQELKQKRVPDDVIEAVLAQDQADEQETIRSIVAKKQSQTRYQDSNKLKAYLSRQGFGYNDIKEVLDKR